MNNPQKNGFYTFPICDCHFHALFNLPLTHTVAAFRNIIRYYDFDRVNLCAILHHNDGQDCPTNNAEVLYYKSQLNTEKECCRAYVCGGLRHFFDERDTAEGYLRQARELYAMGVDGYKLLEGKPEFRKALGKRLDDPIFDLFYGYAEEMGLPIVMHVGDPARNWDITKITPTALQRGWFYDDSFPTLEQLRDEVNGVLTKFPKLKLCLAHFYFLGYELEIAQAMLDKWENVTFDLTPGGEMFVGFTQRHEEWKLFFQTYADRILFGTDTYNVYFKSLDEYEEVMPAGHRINLVRKSLEKEDVFEDMHFGSLKPLALDKAVLMKIYRDNFIRLWGNTPRPVNEKLVAAYTSGLLETYEQDKWNVSKEKAEVDRHNLQMIYEFYTSRI